MNKEGDTNMNRIDSEWNLQQYIMEANEETNTGKFCSSTSLSSTVDINNNNIIDSDKDYRTLLKNNLDLACAAFAMTWGSSGKFQEPEIGPQTSDPYELGLMQTSVKECGPSGNNPAEDIIVAAGAPNMPQKPVVTIRSMTSGSSGDEAYQGGINMNRDKNPSNEKRVKRMLQNRESAKRSRIRKIAYSTELETQVSTLRGDNSSLLKRLSDVEQKYKNSAVENRILNADFETIKAKVNAAEEKCKRLTGSIPEFNAMSEASSMGMSLLDGSPYELSADAYVPVQEDPNYYFFQPTFNNPMSSHDMRGVNNGLGGIISSVESVQKNTAAGWITLNIS